MLEGVQQIIRAFLVLSLAAGIGGSGALAGQSREELRRKYGESIAETFIVRSGVSVTVTYAKDGHITEWLIAPLIREVIKSRAATLTYESAKEIIDELVPSPSRGRYLNAGFVNARCLPEDDCHGSSETYEKIHIYFNSAAPGRVHYVVVQRRE